ncbi:hypothetical protein P7C70_g6322, partial [Phenoliferia sp. Uapishka_3]
MSTTYTTIHSKFENAKDSPYFCPLVTSPRPSSPLTSTSLSPFLPLESTLPEFEISLAYATSACNQFRIKIVRTEPEVCWRMAGKFVHRLSGNDTYLESSPKELEKQWELGNLRVSFTWFVKPLTQTSGKLN